MCNKLHALILFIFMFAVLSLKAQTGIVSFISEIDDLASFRVVFKSHHYTNSGTLVYFTPDDESEYSFEWNFGDGNTGDGPITMHSYASAGTYNVTITVTDLSDPGQIYTSEIIPVTVDDSFEVPNVFTPDGDGINDSFIVRSNGVTPLTITIFDRGGNVVYKRTSPVINWDGRTPGGTRVRPGVYYYVITSPEPLYNKNGFVHIFYNK